MKLVIAQMRIFGLCEPEAGKAIDRAIDETRSHSQVLIIQREARRGRTFLANHFMGRAMGSPDVGRPINAYLSLHGHPHRPAYVFHRGRHSLFDDLAHGGLRHVFDANMIAIDGPESMLTVMPSRLRRFVRCCADRGIFVILLTSSARRLFDRGIEGPMVCIGVDEECSTFVTGGDCDALICAVLAGQGNSGPIFATKEGS